MEKKKKQHYVPRFYLKNFSSDESGKSLNVYNISSNRYISNGNLKNQCYEPYFYGKDLIIENAFSIIEGKAATILKNLLGKTNFPKPFSEEHYVLLLFTLLQYARTKGAEVALKEFIDKVTKFLLEQTGKFEEGDFDKFTIEANNTIAWNLKFMAESIHIAMDLKYKVINNKTGIDFITSDNPVIFYNQAFFEYKGFSSIGLGSKGLQVLLPISPDKYLIFYDADFYKIGDRKSNYTDLVDVRDVHELNKLQWLNSLQNLYYSSPDSKNELTNVQSKMLSLRQVEKTSLIEHAMIFCRCKKMS
ncbi:DUF4238 domain-containing protein [Vibrio parahaemolyticus]|nr:DUF4238 domain-containing protein [Vibrio parahaemolyticus]